MPVGLDEDLGVGLVREQFDGGDGVTTEGIVYLHSLEESYQSGIFNVFGGLAADAQAWLAKVLCLGEI